MFNSKKKQRERECERQIAIAIDELKKAGYAKAPEHIPIMKQYYMTHALYDIAPELQITIMMMLWLIDLYGTEGDRIEIEQAGTTTYSKPQNSIYFYWLPSQFVRCRQLGGEIRLRRQNKKPNQNSPEPFLKQDILERKYIQARDVVIMMKEIAGMPEGMERQFQNFIRQVDKILNIHKQETLIPQTAHTIHLANNYDYDRMDVKSMKPRFEDGSNTFTAYLNGEMPEEDYDKIGKPREENGNAKSRGQQRTRTRVPRR